MRRAIFAALALTCCAPRDESYNGVPFEYLEPPPPAQPAECKPAPEDPPPAREPGPIQPVSDSRLFPADPGLSWTRSVDRNGCPTTYHGTRTLTFTVKTHLLGRDAILFHADDSPKPSTLAFAGDDESILSEDGRRWELVMRGPVSDGDTFVALSRMYTWHRAATQTVAAGTFADCWRLDDTTPNERIVLSYLIFCRGVGLVRSEWVTESGAWEREELLSKSF